jgi:pimeloyl-ACP methyl ester carboxylesterase
MNRHGPLGGWLTWGLQASYQLHRRGKTNSRFIHWRGRVFDGLGSSANPRWHPSRAFAPTIVAELHGVISAQNLARWTRRHLTFIAFVTAAGERGPYVVVGQSIGGMVVRIFAEKYRSETAAIVLVDAYSEDSQLACGRS